MIHLSKEPVFRFFEEISQIPRGSGNEKEISDYLVHFANKRNLNVLQDKANNVIIKKPGTKGYENVPAVILQGHMDMVCDKNKATEHNFEKDPIKLRVDGDMIYATDTTLGADNGIAIAYVLELLNSNNISHPPIEALFTTNEETGMDGAIALDTKDLKGKYLINLDSEEEGILLVSCAGGITVKVSLPISWEDIPEGSEAYEISIRGLKGGHSGAEIHLGRANSNRLLGRLLNGIEEEIQFSLAEISGGVKFNAIPRESDVFLAINSKDADRLREKVKEWEEAFKNEYSSSDPGIKVSIEKSNRDIKKVFTKLTARNAVYTLLLTPNGVQSMSMDIEDLVESSNNLGIVETKEDEILFFSAVRSAVGSLKYSIMAQCKAAAELTGAKFEAMADYPGWQYDPDSRLRDICKTVYERKYGKSPEIAAIHAGLECGLFKEKMPDVDMISLGPNLYDVHTPNEHMSISSVMRVWDYLLDVLKEIR